MKKKTAKAAPKRGVVSAIGCSGIGRDKKLECEDCGARDFLVTVEPSYSDRTMNEDEAAWLRDAKFCPVCGGSCVEVL